MIPVNHKKTTIESSSSNVGLNPTTGKRKVQNSDMSSSSSTTTTTTTMTSSCDPILPTSHFTTCTTATTTNTTTTQLLLSSSLFSSSSSYDQCRRPMKKRQVLFKSNVVSSLPSSQQHTKEAAAAAAALITTTTTTLPDLGQGLVSRTTTTVTEPTLMTTNRQQNCATKKTIDSATVQTTAANAALTCFKLLTSPFDARVAVVGFGGDGVDTNNSDERSCRDTTLDIDLGNNNTVVPLPPRFIRSTAQIIPYYHHHHSPPPPQQQQRSPLLSNHQAIQVAATSATVPLTIVHTNDDHCDHLTTTTNVSVKHIDLSSDHTATFHKSSTDFDDRFYFDSDDDDYDKNGETVPPLTDELASLALKRSSSLPPKFVTPYTKSTTNSNKNYNKVLPTCGRRSIGTPNTSSLLLDHYDDMDDKFKTLTGPAWKNNIPKSSNAIFHSISSDATVDMSSSSPNTVPVQEGMVPPELMTGKVISTKYGLAMVVVPSFEITALDYTNTFASSTAMHTLPNNSITTKLVAPSNPVLGGMSATATTGGTTRFKHWLKSEDDLLQYAISQQINGPPYMWQDLAQTYFPNTRNANQCKSRWRKIDPSLAKNPFTPKEDEIILKGKEDELSWPEIAVQLPGRNSDQVRARFINSINPALMKNVAWTVKEEQILHKAQSELGNKWSIITSLLPGRSENDVKNHWHNQKLKAKRKLQSMVALTERTEMLMNLRNSNYDSSSSITNVDLEENGHTSSNDFDITTD